MQYKIMLKVKKNTDFPSIVATEVYSDLSKKLNIVKMNPDVFGDDDIDNNFEFIYICESSEITKRALNSLKKEIKLKKNVVSIKIMEIEKIETGRGEKEKTEIMENQENKKIAMQESKNIRVDVEKLNSLGNLLGEFVINHSSIYEDVNFLYNYNKLPSEIEPAVNNLIKNIRKSELILKELQYVSLKMRMLPINILFNRFPRVVRDLGKKFNKHIELIINGGNTEIDKSLIEELNDPIIHLIRNAVDHGIENKEEREKSGKSEISIIKLNAYEESDLIVIEISDDGRGIDIEKIKDKIVKQGLKSADDLKNLSTEDIINYIFYPGFSTAERVTDLSGRGVGMDVVKNNISKLNGRIDIKTEKNKGTTFYLKLPLTLSIINVLLVEVAGEIIAIPIVNIIRIINIPKSGINLFQNEMLVDIDNNVLELFYLGKLLNFKELPELDREEYDVIIMGSVERKFCIIVDRIIDKQNIVIKKLNDYIGSVRGISGGTILGNGKAALILDIRDLIKTKEE